MPHHDSEPPQGPAPSNPGGEAGIKASSVGLSDNTQANTARLIKAQAGLGVSMEVVLEWMDIECPPNGVVRVLGNRKANAYFIEEGFILVVGENALERVREIVCREPS